MIGLGQFLREKLQKLPYSAKRDLEDLILKRFNIDRLTLITEPDYQVDEKVVEEEIQRLEKGEPLAYILGEVPFFGCHIKVNRSVLIPRPETELLVAYVLEEIRGKGGILVDLCTGSGCIAIAMKKALPDLRVYASDISPQALEIAKENADLNEVHIHFLEGDFLEPLKKLKFDYLISNPPYVTPEEYLILDRSVREYEPKIALVAEKNGLYFYEKLANEGSAFLHQGGELFLEIGAFQGDQVSKLFDLPHWKNTKVEKDLASHPRFIHTYRA